MKSPTVNEKKDHVGHKKIDDGRVRTPGKDPHCPVHWFQRRSSRCRTPVRFGHCLGLPQDLHDDFDIIFHVIESFLPERSGVDSPRSTVEGTYVELNLDSHLPCTRFPRHLILTPQDGDLVGTLVDLRVVY